MSESMSTPDEWRRLYQATIRVKELAPWDWMTEMDVFGVQNPETNKLGFVSVMGRYGEHYSLAVYLGPKGLYRYWAFVDLGEAAPAEMLLEIPHLQAMFEDRNVLRTQDRKQIKELGFKFRGRNAWPMFRSYRPGYFPWYLEPREVRFLTHVLEQAIDVALRFKEDPRMLDAAGEYDYLVRVPTVKEGALVWQDQVREVRPPEPEAVPIPMDVGVLEALGRLPQSQYRLEVDCFQTPFQVGERGARPYIPYMLLMVDSDSGMVLASELLKVESTLEALWGLVPTHVVHMLARYEIVPQQIRVRSPLLLQLLNLLVDELGFELIRSSRLPSLDSAKEFLLGRFV